MDSKRTAEKGMAPVDTVTIMNVVYDPVAQTLRVAAQSSDQPVVSLTAQGYGPLVYRATGTPPR